MALQTSGSISLSQIQTELGGSNPITMTEYYKGGIYVGSSGQGNGSIPTSGALDMTDFYGADNTIPGPVPEWHFATASGNGSYSIVSGGGYDDYWVGITNDGSSCWSGADNVGIIRCTAGTTTVVAVGVRASNIGGFAGASYGDGWVSHSGKAGSNTEQLSGAGTLTSASWNGSNIVGFGVNSRTVFMNGSTAGFSLTMKKFY